VQQKFRISGIVTLLLLIGLLLRTGALLGTKAYEHPGAWEYGDIAQSIAAGNGFSRVARFSDSLEPTSSHAPLYPYLLAFSYKTTGGAVPLLILQIILSTITILLIHQTALLLFNRTAASISALFICLYPPLIYYSIKLTPTTLFLFLLASTILLILKLNNARRRTAIAAGFTLGLSILCNPVAFSLIPAIILHWIITGREILKQYIILFVITLLTLIPWTIRNYAVHHSLIPITTQAGVNFWIGNNPHATGTDYYKVSSPEQGDFVLMVETLPRSTKQNLISYTEIERANFFLSEGMKFIKKEPAKFIILLGKKALYFWWFAPLQINGSPDANKYRNFHIVLYLPVLILGLCGVFFSLYHPVNKKAVFITCFIILLSLIYIITHVGLIRYRMPVEIYLMMFGSFTLSRFLHRRFFK